MFIIVRWQTNEAITILNGMARSASQYWEMFTHLTVSVIISRHLFILSVYREHVSARGDSWALWSEDTAVSNSELLRNLRDKLSCLQSCILYLNKIY